MLLKRSKIILCFATVLVLAGCQTMTSKTAWPDDMPERQIFVDDYLQKMNVKSAKTQALRSHLIWIIRFYQGTVLYKNGWNNASSLFLASLNSSQDKANMEQRLYVLGIKIANEWAQTNELRNIDSRNIAIWGSAMRTAAERQDQEGFVSKVEHDVDTLITRKLQAQQIEYERYYPEEDYDNF